MCVVRREFLHCACLYFCASEFRYVLGCWFLLFVESKQGVQCSVEGVGEKNSRIALVPTELSVCNVV
jgi:hypothetical protein